MVLTAGIAGGNVRRKMRTVIYTQRVEIVETYRERRDCADRRIAEYIHTCGFLPVPLPNKAELAETILQNLQPKGIILTGGNSLVQYGGNAPERDAMDAELIRLAVQYKVPLYGFCRGMQSILYYYGNELVNVEGHAGVRHDVQEGNESYEVNSYHNQACRELKAGCGLKVTAKTADGIIEAVCHENLPIFGTMWHPEREEKFAEKDIERVKKILNCCGGS